MTAIVMMTTTLKNVVGMVEIAVVAIHNAIQMKSVVKEKSLKMYQLDQVDIMETEMNITNIIVYQL